MNNYTNEGTMQQTQKKTPNRKCELENKEIKKWHAEK
jgi:hypothetical protein